MKERTIRKATLGGFGSSFLGLAAFIQLIGLYAGIDLGPLAYGIALGIAVIIGLAVYWIPNVNTPQELVAFALAQLGMQVDPETVRVILDQVLADLNEADKA